MAYTVEITFMDIPEPPWIEKMYSFVHHVLQFMNITDCEVSLVFCRNEFIHRLNSDYRGKDEPTDVLSFSQIEGEHPMNDSPSVVGDIVISLDMVHENAAEFHVSPDQELKRLVIHGLLHLYGHDHETNSETEPMLKKQEEILNNTDREKIL